MNRRLPAPTRWTGHERMSAGGHGYRACEFRTMCGRVQYASPAPTRPGGEAFVPPYRDEEPAAVMAAALAPYAWRHLTGPMLARRVVGVIDRHTVVLLLGDVPGADVGEPAPVGPADAGDVRVEFLTGALAGKQWRAWSLDRLCAELRDALEAWAADRDAIDAALRRLLEGH